MDDQADLSLHYESRCCVVVVFIFFFFFFFFVVVVFCVCVFCAPAHF